MRKVQKLFMTLSKNAVGTWESLFTCKRRDDLVSLNAFLKISMSPSF